MYDENNIFAKIIKGEIACKKVYEDEKTLFFHDINPIAEVHILGIPKKPCIDFSDFVKNFDSSAVSDFFIRAEKIIESIGINNSGYKIITNSGKDGGQEVPHFHIHIIGGKKLK